MKLEPASGINVVSTKRTNQTKLADRLRDVSRVRYKDQVNYLKERVEKGLYDAAPQNTLIVDLEVILREKFFGSMLNGVFEAIIEWLKEEGFTINTMNSLRIEAANSRRLGIDKYKQFSGNSLVISW